MQVHSVSFKMFGVYQLTTNSVAIISHRSEIHENMNCARCKEDGLMAVNNIVNEIEDDDSGDSCDGKQKLSGLVNDIGGFAEIAGCLQKLTSSQRQVTLT